MLSSTYKTLRHAAWLQFSNFGRFFQPVVAVERTNRVYGASQFDTILNFTRDSSIQTARRSSRPLFFPPPHLRAMGVKMGLGRRRNAPSLGGLLPVPGTVTGPAAAGILLPRSARRDTRQTGSLGSGSFKTRPLSVTACAMKR